MKFNTQVCTTREQSERLLALGLKKETADCFRWEYLNRWYVGQIDEDGITANDIPSWSFDRMFAMISDAYTFVGTDGYKWDSSILVRGQIVKFVAFPVVVKTFNNDNLFDNLIDCIEWLIKENHFNKQYLNESL